MSKEIKQNVRPVNQEARDATVKRMANELMMGMLADMKKGSKKSK